MQVHEQIECTIVEGTELQYDRIYHMYECPICKKQHRYAEPNVDEYVFCTGDDFGLFISQVELPIEIPEEYFTNHEEVTE